MYAQSFLFNMSRQSFHRFKILVWLIFAEILLFTLIFTTLQIFHIHIQLHYTLHESKNEKRGPLNIYFNINMKMKYIATNK